MRTFLGNLCQFEEGSFPVVVCYQGASLHDDATAVFLIVVNDAKLCLVDKIPELRTTLDVLQRRSHSLPLGVADAGTFYGSGPEAGVSHIVADGECDLKGLYELCPRHFALQGGDFASEHKPSAIATLCSTARNDITQTSFHDSLVIVCKTADGGVETWRQHNLC